MEHDDFRGLDLDFGDRGGVPAEVSEGPVGEIGGDGFVGEHPVGDADSHDGAVESGQFEPGKEAGEGAGGAHRHEDVLGHGHEPVLDLAGQFEAALDVTQGAGGIGPADP